VYGAETSGLPPEAHADILSRAGGGGGAGGGDDEHGGVGDDGGGGSGALVKIPIVQTHVRSLNVAVCVGVGVFEALRQLDAAAHAVAPRDDRGLRLPTPMMQQQQQQQQPGGGGG
jgi:hypothetical protein